MAKFYSVGVGAGDGSYITLGALRALEQADIIAVPVKKYGEKSTALEIIRKEFDTVVIMKSGNDTDVIYDILKKYGLENNAIVSSCIGMENEIIEKIQKGKSYGYFTTVIVRK